MIAFDPGPCGKPVRTYTSELLCSAVHRHVACEPLTERITDAIEHQIWWFNALAMSLTWAALLGRAADQAEARLRVSMRHAHKRAVIEHMLTRDPVLMHVDPRVAGADLPAHLTEPTALRFGHQLSPAIPDLVIDDLGISGTLSFGGREHRCVLPWSAVYAARLEGTDQRMVWPEDVPADVVAVPRASEDTAPTPKRSGHLRSVP